jgi:hypothetical protein
MVFLARIFFFYPNIGTQLGLTHLFHSSSILSHSGWWRWRGGRGEEVEWRQGKDCNDDLSPSFLFIFCLSGSGKNLQEENQFTKRPKTSSYRKYFFFLLNAFLLLVSPKTLLLRSMLQSRIRSKNIKSFTF